MESSRCDVLVVGSGFGGLGAALRLAEGGARVVLCEALRYPGGCASTFERGGRRYEAGATLFSGFARGQLFDRWISRHNLDVRFVPLDPVVEMHAPGLELAVPSSREGLVERLVALAPSYARGLRAFFDEQHRVADALWSIFDDPTLLPPFGLDELVRHASRSLGYLPLVSLIGRPLGAVLERHGVRGCAPLVTFLDAVCQITVQTSSREAEAPFALAAMDYYFRGTGHLRGGIGTLAHALTGAIERNGGSVRFCDAVKRVEVLERKGGVRVTTRGASFEARHAVLNVLPHDARRLLGRREGEHRALDAMAKGVETGWGAAMRYLVVRGEGLPDAPRHLELVRDPAREFTEGNHVFCSIAGRGEDPNADPALRSVTMSTHVRDPGALSVKSPEAGERVRAVHEAMRETVRARAPWLEERVVHEMTASPRTFARFVGRAGGFVGGIPRRAGLQNYTGLWPGPVERGVWMVGDSVFPGQSTLATARSGVKVAEAILARSR